MFLTDQQMAYLALRCLFICLFLIYGEVKACSRRKPPKSCIDKKINVHSPGRTSWCSPTKNTKDIFFEVDLAKQYLLCKVSTQGDSKYSFTKSYKVKLSSNRIQWRFYQNNDGTDKIFQGNNDSSTIVRHSLTATKRTRFVRFYPISFETNACIRVKLYGQEVIKADKCEKNLMLDTSAPDITVNSFPTVPPRIYSAIVSGTKQWCWENFTEPYLKANFHAHSIICALQVSQLNETVKISYGNESSNTSQVWNIAISHILQYFRQ